MPNLASRPIHVGLFSPALPSKGASNGIVTYVRILRDALKTLGHQVTIVDTQHIEHSDGRIAALPAASGLASRMETLAESWRGRERQAAFVRVRLLHAFDALKTAGVEVVEIEETWGWAARLSGSGLPVVMRLHGPHALGRESVTKSTVDHRREVAELSAFSQVAAISCPSSRLIEAMEEIGAPSNIVSLIRNPVLVPEKQWSLKTANVDQVLCVGRFDLRKGADTVIQAFAAALERRPQLKLVMVGPDTGLGGAIHFNEFITKLPPTTQSNISFLGEQTRERIDELRLSSGFVIVGSRFENFPYAAFEAQALGVPLLSTEVFGVSEIVSDGVSGKIVPVADINAMANAIVSMVDDTTRLERMGEAGRKLIAEKLDPLSIAQETIQLYRKVLGPSRDGTSRPTSL